MLVDILFTAVNAVLPIVLLILLGYLLRRKGLLSKEFVKTGNALVFKVCLPCMLFVNVYEISDSSQIPWDVVAYCCAAILVLFVLGLGAAAAVTKQADRRGVITQCCFRSNFAIIGIPLAAALGGEEAAAVAALISALAIPLFNVLAVVSLSVFRTDGAGNRPGLKKILLDIIKNPLIIAVAAGLVCLAVRGLQSAVFGRVVFSLSRDLPFVYSVAEKLKAIASSFALLVLGGQFEFSAVKGMTKEIVWATGLRVIAAPVLCIGGALLLNSLGVLSCTSREIPALVALFGSPVAVSSAIMASQMGNDEQLAAQLVVWTSITSVLTIFAAVCVLMGIGVLAV